MEGFDAGVDGGEVKAGAVFVVGGVAGVMFIKVWYASWI